MTRQQQNQSFDQKKGAADERVTGQRQGIPGHTIADGEEPMDLPVDASDTESTEKSTREKATIPEQKGCGPNVTDYPGLSNK
jgi:hypothetical protein